MRFVTEQAVTPVGQNELWLTIDSNTQRPVEEVRDWAMYLSGSDKAVNTLRSYIPKVTFFLNWAEGFGVDWREVKLAHLTRYRWHVETGAPHSAPRGPVTVNLYITALAEFLRYCALVGHVAPAVSAQMREPRFLAHLPSGMNPGESGQHRTVMAKALRARHAKRPPSTLDQVLAEHVQV